MSELSEWLAKTEGIKIYTQIMALINDTNSKLPQS